ncbi:aminopeptidase P family protein [Moorena sp. SIO3I6]|uniref:aminopeptidase P family protein n=1 Tax=Moorena sp. SIO3I6 TaxID=2607831 RepID=UPI0013FC0DAB|nr:aminopeptidase P family protein [Moorena sp. SIO3I6]NEP21345.1 aminopeptidase P family protein [Moorena sp. SIO3I6]
MINNHDGSLATTLKQRRQKLAQLVDFPVMLWSGHPSPRNFRANSFPFRASSHFLYFAGLPLTNAVIGLNDGKLDLFMDKPAPGSALWHGEVPSPEEIAEMIGADRVFPFSELRSHSVGFAESHSQGAATIAVQNPTTYSQQQELLGRAVGAADAPEGIDLDLAKAIISLRLYHDEGALSELRQAAEVSMAAHKAGMAATPKAKREAEVRGAMESVIIAHNMTRAYTSIVTVHGEVLHNGEYHHSLQPGELLLADVGAETPMGWAADITRTWPVSGKFSPTQRDIYNVVKEAHDFCIKNLYPGVEYREIHMTAAGVIAEGLIDLGILRGDISDLVAMDAHALFFPHGVGHLLGLDVHDMEDLGDLAGYAPGRVRSDRFGLGFLRLDRLLEAGMLVTIEPGFYQVPGILNDPDRRSTYKDVVDWDRLAQFDDVRGIRIEDDVLITETGAEVLTAGLPTDLEAVEDLVTG